MYISCRTKETWQPGHLPGNAEKDNAETKRETFQQAIKYIPDAFCESFAAGLCRCNFLNVSDVAFVVVVVVILFSFCSSSQFLPYSTSILIAKYGDNFKEVKDIDAP